MQLAQLVTCQGSVHPFLIWDNIFLFLGLPLWLRWYSVCLQCGRPGFDPWVEKIPWRRKWQPTPVYLPGKFHGLRRLVGYSSWGCKESDTTELLHFTSLHFLFLLSKFEKTKWKYWHGSVCSKLQKPIQITLSAQLGNVNMSTYFSIALNLKVSLNMKLHEFPECQIAECFITSDCRGQLHFCVLFLAMFGSFIFIPHSLKWTVKELKHQNWGNNKIKNIHIYGILCNH